MQSLPTLQVLEIEFVMYYGFPDRRSKHTPSSLLQLIEAAGNSQLKEITFDAMVLLSKFQEHYRRLLKCVQKYYTFELYYTSVCCFRLETAAICRLNCFYCTCSNVVASVHMYDDSLKIMNDKKKL